jgi:hypothetical protein
MSQVRIALTIVKKTAALPISFARFARLFFSREILSTVASIPEFKSSIMSTANILDTNNAV